MDTHVPPINITADSFYGKNKAMFNENNVTLNIPPRLRVTKKRRIIGPSDTWKIFRKQDSLLTYIHEINFQLLPFTYQDADGTRLFLAADPKRFWTVDQERNFKDRNSYEIIQENLTSKLYFDLEFDQLTNSTHNGDRMVESFICLVCLALKNKYDIVCDDKQILVLDSSTEIKYSCHLIFQLNVAFTDNYNVGCFVKQLCHEIKLLLKHEAASEKLFLLRNNPLAVKYVQELQVTDLKGNIKLFCDEGVYTKNRHFRLYKSSKFGKNVPLLISKLNKFSCDNEEDIFLSSLITYFKNCKPLQILESEFESSIRRSAVPKSLPYKASAPSDEANSLFPKVDEFIDNIVNPGKIRKAVYFEKSGVITYDIVGNRYCSNIGQQHKSNNVRYIVDLLNRTYYQKCYDPECAGYKSPEHVLPINEKYLMQTKDDNLLVAALQSCEQKLNGEETQKAENSKNETTNLDVYFTEINEEEMMAIGLEETHDSIIAKEKVTSDVFFNDINEEEMIAADETRTSKVTKEFISSHINEKEISAAVEQSENPKIAKENLFSNDIDEEEMIAIDMDKFSHAEKKHLDGPSVFFTDINEDEMIASADVCERRFSANEDDKVNAHSTEHSFMDDEDDHLLLKATEKCETSIGTEANKTNENPSLKLFRSN